MLVIPGVTTPRAAARPRTNPAPTPEPSTATSLPPVSLPPLDGPHEAADLGLPPGFLPESPAPRPTSTPGNRRPGAPGAGSPSNEIRLERPEGAEGGSRGNVGPLPGDRPRPSSTMPAPARRSSGLFGRFLPPPPPSDRPLAARDPRSRVTVEPRSDPAADAALKRRIERQIRDSLGNRVASYEVRVVGREVVIRARPARFWQRRAVRSTLESLSGLNGYRTTVLVDD